MFDNLPYCQFGVFKVFFTFGSAKEIERWFDCFMDVPRIKEIKNREVRGYFNKLVGSMSGFSRSLVLAVIIWILTFLIEGPFLH